MRQIPIATKNLLIINIVAFIATYLLGGSIDIKSMFGLHFFLAADFSVIQLVTYMFLHSGFLHLFFNMFALWMFGCVIENVLGTRKFLIYYFISGIGAGLMQEVAQYVQFYTIISGSSSGLSFTDVLYIAKEHAVVLNGWTTIGASGAVYAILLAFGMIFPNERIFIFPLPVPIKAKWFVIFYVAIELFSAISSSSDGVAHTAHLGGMLFGFLLLRYWRSSHKSYYDESSGRQFFDRLRKNFEAHKGRSTATDTRFDDYEDVTDNNASNETDAEYNARKKAEQDEIDAILDKIRKSGYDSLTKAEKKRLFDKSNE